MSTTLFLIALPLVLTSALDVIEWVVTLPVEIFQGYSSLLHWAADAVQSLFERYGYWVVFFATLSENTLLVGVIVPGALVVILAGLAAHDGTIYVPFAILLGIAGTILGDTLSYFLGRYGWVRFGRSKMLSELSDKVREPLLRRGPLFVVFYHFAGYTRVIGPTAAGLLRMPFRRWAIADYTGATLWICVYLGVGYGLGMLGLSLDSSDRWFRLVEYIVLVAIGMWILVILRAHTNVFSAPAPQEEQEEKEEAPPVSEEPAQHDGRPR